MVVVVVKKAPLVAVELIELGPELGGRLMGGAGEQMVVVLPPFDWKEALRLTFGDGRSEPASLELVV